MDPKELQRFLQSQGYDIGRAGVDGIVGRMTKAALAKWQADHPEQTIEDAMSASARGQMGTYDTSRAPVAQPQQGGNFQDESLEAEIARLVDAQAQGQTRSFDAGGTGPGVDLHNRTRMPPGDVINLPEIVVAPNDGKPGVKYAPQDFKPDQYEQPASPQMTNTRPMDMNPDLTGNGGPLRNYNGAPLREMRGPLREVPTTQEKARAAALAQLLMRSARGG